MLCTTEEKGMNSKLVRIIKLLACATAIASIYYYKFDSFQGAVLVAAPYCVFFTTIKASDTKSIVNIAAYVFLALASMSAIMLFGIQPDAQASIGVTLLLTLQYLIAITFLVAYWRGSGGLRGKSA
tara:strand:+ start:149 stop:526 length:378 start_codon:yes stop_codon:yes gene_type:complete